LNLKKPIYLITDGGKLRQENILIEKIEEALIGAEGAIGYVQLREQVENPDRQLQPASDNEVLKLSERLLPLCQIHGAKLIINRRFDLAKTAGADGVHLGNDSPAIAAVRKELWKEALIGRSVHSSKEAQAISKENPDYLLLAPIFLPLSKPPSQDPLGLEALAHTSSSISCPVFALGGITEENTSLCRSTGAAGVAMITSILGSSNPSIAAKKIREAWFSLSPQP